MGEGWVLTRGNRIAMSFNGYMIICIWIGAFLGFFAFRWETLSV